MDHSRRSFIQRALYGVGGAIMGWSKPWRPVGKEQELFIANTYVDKYKIKSTEK